MAEDLVLARLTVDSSGVVSGIGTSTQQMQRGEQALTRFGSGQTALASTTQLVTNRMFSFRAALMGVTRVLGIAGIVIALVGALVSLGRELITSTTLFKQASEAVTDWWNALVKGEDSVGRLTRKMEALSKGTGVSSVAEQVKQLESLLKARAEIGGLSGLSPLEKALKREEVERYDKEIQSLVINLSKVGVSPKQLASLEDFNRAIAMGGGGGTLKPGTTVSMISGEIVPQHVLDKEAAEAAKRRADEVRRLGIALQAQAAHEAISTRETIANLAAVDDWMVQARSVQDMQEILGSNFEALSEDTRKFSASLKDLHDKAAKTLEQRTEWDDFTDFLENATSKVTLGFNLMMSAVSSFAGGVSEALLGGKFSFRKFAGDMLASLVPVLLAFGALALVRGFVFSDPSQFKAAGIAFAAAAAAGLAARALGAGGGGERASSGGGGGVGAASGGGGGTREQNVTVNVLGSIPLGVTPDEFARMIANLLRTATSDGGA